MAIIPTRYETLSAMITPALFMTANGSLIISTSNRMARIVDRIRILNDQVDRLSRGVGDLDYLDERQAHLAELVRSMERRSSRIRMALTLLYLAFCMFVGTSLTLAIDVLTGNRIEALPSLLAVAGTALMLIACVYLVSEAHSALRSNRTEAEFYRSLATRRAVERPR